MVSVPYQIAVISILLLPTLSPVDATNFNYTSAVAGIVLILGVINWELSSKFTFKGPKRSDDDMYDDENDAYDDAVGLGDGGGDTTDGELQSNSKDRHDDVYKRSGVDAEHKDNTASV